MENNNEKLEKIYCFDEMPEAKMKLYAFLGPFISVYFDTEEKLQEFVTNYKALGRECVIDYIGNVAGEKDVIRLRYKNKRPIICTILNEGGYAFYDTIKSGLTKKYVWEYERGKLLDIYSEFNKRGLVFEDDVYYKIIEKINNRNIPIEQPIMEENSAKVKKICPKK